MHSPRTTPTAAVDEHQAVLRPPLVRNRASTKPNGTPSSGASLAERLMELHFIAQHEAEDLSGVQIPQLDSFLRGLLFTDGTVTRALEAHTLCEVAVEPVEQEPGPAPARIARYLELDGGEDCLRRRVVMRIGGSRLASVWAESYVLEQRLPQEFLPRLGGDTQGIGSSFQQLKLESRRDLLWFGLGAPPLWAPEGAPATTTLTRAYRVMTRGRPALLICESFAVELGSSQYHLMGPAPA
ncbi:MAG TPA: chorismate pyruvate-lyase family protein [Solirubrobacteraceae bacterium]